MRAVACASSGALCDDPVVNVYQIPLGREKGDGGGDDGGGDDGGGWLLDSRASARPLSVLAIIPTSYPARK